MEYDRVHDGWMRFHDMFADVLRSEARALGVPRWQNIEVDTIDALMDRGEVDLAVARLQRITDPVVLARIIVDPANPSAPRRQVETLFERRDLSNVVNVFARVPVESLPGSLIVLFVSCGQALTNGDYPRARELHDVLARMPLPDAVLSAPEYVGLEALYQSLLGDVDASIDVVQRHLDARRDSSDFNLWTYLAQGAIVDPLFMADRLDEAAEHARLALAIADRGGFMIYRPAFNATIGIAALTNGDVAGGRLALARAEEAMATTRGWWDVSMAAALQAMIAMADGDLEGARRALLGAVSEPSFQRACRSSAFLYLLLADVEQQLDLPAECASRLNAAQALMNGAPGAHLFARMAQAVRPDGVGGARTVGGPGHSGAPVDSMHELTDRERSIYRLLRSRLTLREIGDELYLSVNTVKTHTQSIYRKLGVASRTEAIAVYGSSR